MREGKKKRKIVIDISTHRLVIRVYSRYPISLSPPPVDVEHIDDVWIGRPADYYGSSSNSP
jgi:hypothetical protein